MTQVYRGNDGRMVTLFLGTILFGLLGPGIQMRAVNAQEIQSALPAEWRVESVKLKNHDKSYSAGRFILFPAKKHQFVIVSFRLTGAESDPMAVEELAAAQKLAPDASKALKETVSGNYRCFDMHKLALVDSEGRRHPALWNTDDTITTDVVTLTGTSGTTGRDPAHWTKTKRTAVKLSKESREQLIKAGTLEANHPDFRTTFSGLLEIDQPVEVAFLFQLPDGVKREGLQIKYEAPAAPGRPATVAHSNQPNDPNGTGTVAINKPNAEPAWDIVDAVLHPFGPTYTFGQANVRPGDGESLVTVSFKLKGLTADPKVAVNYANVWNNVDRRSLPKLLSAARVFHLRNMALVDRSGRRHLARWVIDDNVRLTYFTSEIFPNSQSTRHSSSWKQSPDSIWLDAEQTFTTRTVHTADGRTFTEHLTGFAGILAIDRQVELKVLFSLPTDIDQQGLKLEFDSVSQPVGTPTTVSQ